jgi:hypothetical protein
MLDTVPCRHVPYHVAVPAGEEALWRASIGHCPARAGQRRDDLYWVGLHHWEGSCKPCQTMGLQLDLLVGRPASNAHSWLAHDHLAAVKDPFPKIFHPQDGIIGTARWRCCNAGLDHLTDDNGMVPLLDGLHDAALHKGWSRF